MTGGVKMASLVFFSSEPAELAAVLHALGVTLEPEQHEEEEPEHWAGEVGGVHLAVYGAETSGWAAPLRSGGSVFPGLYVEALEPLVAAGVQAGARDVTGHQRRPWGCRHILACPGGFTIEVNQRAHCPHP